MLYAANCIEVEMSAVSKTPSRVRRILVVEDDPDFAFLISIILRDAGYSVKTAGDAEEAFAEICHGASPDLITLDLHMPRKSGAHFYVETKSNPQYRNIPVIVITGLRESTEADTVIRSFLAAEGRPAPEAYFDKPFDRHELVRAVIRSLGRISDAGAPRI